MIRTREGVHNLRLMRRVLNVSPAGYYAWRERPPSLRALKQVWLDTRVREVIKKLRCIRQWMLVDRVRQSAHRRRVYAKSAAIKYVSSRRSSVMTRGVRYHA